MTHLYFEEMMILSKSEKKAKKVLFSKTINVILGENDVGKSTLMKSLYHTLGADAPQINNSRWKNSRAIYCLKFSINGFQRYILRDGKYFGLFDENKILIAQATGIGGDDGIGKLVNNFLNFHIELQKADGASVVVNPAFYFLPYYIDQDEGWKTSWSSFSGLQMISRYKVHMIDYHLGIKSQSYYDALAKKKAFETETIEDQQELKGLIRLKRRYKNEKRAEILEIDPKEFKAEIDRLVIEYNRVYSLEQSKLNQVKVLRNKNIAFQQEIDVLEASVKELNSDYKYLENPTTPDEIDCPTCGTEFHNSISERFGILDDIDFSRSLIDQKKKGLMKSFQNLQTSESEYNTISKEVGILNELLSMKKEAITLAEIIQSEAHKSALVQIEESIESLESNIKELIGKLGNILPNLEVDKKRTREINKFYSAQMKASLNDLNVHVLDAKDYQTPHKLMKTNALGSDLPRSLLARYFSLLHTMAEFNSFITCPAVIDSPLQQEQDDENSQAIFSFISKSLLSGQQLILGTLSNESFFPEEMSNANANVIELNEKFGLLQSDEFDEVLATIGTMHNLTLQVRF